MKVSILCGALVVAGVVGIAASPLAAQQRNNSSTYQEKPDPLAPGKKAVHDAQVDVNKAQGVMTQIKLRAQHSMETKDDWKAAKTARDQAHAEYEADVRTVMENLKKNPDYAAALKQRNDLQTQMDAATTGSAKLSDEDLQKLASDRAKVGIQIANMEKAAKENDPKIMAANEKVRKADEDWKGLLGQVDEAVKGDADYAKAEKDLEAANDKLKQARMSLATQAKAQRDAELASEKAKSNARSSSGSSGGGSYRR